VTFLPNDTALADFVYDGSPAGGVALLAWEPRSYMGDGKPELARKAADDVAAWAWRRREALLTTVTVHPISHGVKLAKDAAAREWPVVLADHSDRSGSATWILQQVIAQDLSDVLLATIADRRAVEAVRAKGLKAGDPFDMDVGGLADESAGQPEQPFLGTVRLEALPYRNVDISTFYPYGDVIFPGSQPC
jgi:microcystin degradation protein MlrC